MAVERERGGASWALTGVQGGNSIKARKIPRTRKRIFFRVFILFCLFISESIQYFAQFWTGNIVYGKHFRYVLPLNLDSHFWACPQRLQFTGLYLSLLRRWQLERWLQRLQFPRADRRTSPLETSGRPPRPPTPRRPLPSPCDYDADDSSSRDWSSWRLADWPLFLCWFSALCPSQLRVAHVWRSRGCWASWGRASPLPRLGRPSCTMGARERSEWWRRRPVSRGCTAFWSLWACAWASPRPSMASW